MICNIDCLVMEKIIIRKATLNDLQVLLCFEQSIIDTERPFDPTIKDGEIHYYDIAQMIMAENVEVLVAEFDGEVIGSGYARIETAKIYLKHQKHAYLGFMYVEPGYRGKGINRKIVDALKNWSIAQNVTELRLEVYNDNVAAIKAYEKTGFTRHMIEMRIGLADLLSEKLK
jgi:ribosomal protein S18 acetylase RimI-like enzyme